ncbi:dpy-30 [Gorgonomyces haynaldii]|nr:dpy-30 [Gorgonomyces haynaldii]
MDTEPSIEATEDAPILEDTPPTRKEIEELASSNEERMNALPLRAYLDQTVMPTLVEGLKLLAKERPPNPTEWLGVFLLKNSK